MILRSEISTGSQAGFTLLETLITLTILALATAVSVAAIKGPSPQLHLQRQATLLQAKAAQHRHLAVSSRRPLTWQVGALSCDSEKAEVAFLPNGTAHGPDLCLSIDGNMLRMTLLPLSGHYQAAAIR